MTASKEPIHWSQLLFFDTETTGLGVGAGNVPFMLGFGYYTDEAFIVEQCVLRNAADEPAMLGYFAQMMQQYKYIVSYNGRTFDWPVLKNRYIMNRLTWHGEHLQQLDFLYPSRSLWRRILPSCSLASVENARLGFIRDEDVPGSLAPTLYFQYMQREEPKLLDGVFVHNERDILSLAGLASYFAGVLSGSISYSNMDVDELMSLAKWLDKVGEMKLAEQAYEELLQRSDQELTPVAYALAEVMKRRKRWSEAVRLWKIDEKKIDSLIELAKYYEHTEKNYDQALQFTERAYESAWRRKELTRGNKNAKQQLQQIVKRRMRLLDKQERLNKKQQRYEQGLYEKSLFDSE